MLNTSHHLLFPPKLGRLFILTGFFAFVMKPGYDWKGFYFFELFNSFFENVQTVIGLSSMLLLFVIEVYIPIQYRRSPHYLLTNFTGVIGLIFSMTLFFLGGESTLPAQPYEYVFSAFTILAFAICLVDFLLSRISIMKMFLTFFIMGSLTKDDDEDELSEKESS